MFTLFSVFVALLALLFVWLAYTSNPEDVFEFRGVLDVPAIRARWARRWRRLVARVAGWLW